MIIRSKAPLRIGLAGGGTDVSPYSDIYGGAILNATISKYAYASIIPRDDDKIIINSQDRNQSIEYKSLYELPITDTFKLIEGVYNRIIKDFIKKPLSFEISTNVDAPPGSGLGSSSTLVVTVLGAFVEWLKLPLNKYDIAKLAYEIERVDLKMAGGKQDQYAATFGGVNFMEFGDSEMVIVSPLQINSKYLKKLSNNIILFNTEKSRFSSIIIEDQASRIANKHKTALHATHSIKKQAILMKEVFLSGELDKIGEILNLGWKNKKMLAENISNTSLEEIYKTAIKNGASGGKISGAGGGGFMILYCPNNTQEKVIKSLDKFKGSVMPYEFIEQGLSCWID